MSKRNKARQTPDNPEGDPETSIEENEAPAVETAVEAAPKKPKDTPKVEEIRPLVVLKVYLAACGVKWDQMAGFKAYATNKKLKPRTILNWRKAYQDYLNMPIG